MTSDSSSGGYGDFNLASQINSFKAFILLVCAVLGGGLQFDGTGAGYGMSGELNATLSFVSITSIAAICAFNYLIVRKAYRGARFGGWKSAVLVSGLHALVQGLVFLIVSLFGKLSFQPGDFLSASISPRYAAVFFTVVLAVFFAQFLATVPLPASTPSAWMAGLWEAITLLVIVLACFALVGVVMTLVNKDEDTSWSVVLILLPLLGSLGSYIGALGFLGAVAPNVSGAAAMMQGYMEGFIGDDMPSTTLRIWDFANGKGAWLLVLTALIIVAAALRIGVHRGRNSGLINIQRLWQLPLATLLLWMLLAWLTNLSIGGTISAGEFGNMQAAISLGITWYSVIFLTLGAAVVSLLAEFLPMQAYRFAPALLALVAGKAAASRWITGQSSAAGAASATTAQVAASTPETAVYAPAVSAEPAAAPAETTAVSQPSVAAPLPEISPMSEASKKKAKTIGISVVALAVLIGLGFGAVSFLNAQRKPEAEVQKYLELLAEGKATKATEMVDPGVDNASRVLLTDEALGNAKQRLEIISVTQGSKDKNQAIVEATYAINGERHQRTFHVDGGKKDFGLLDTWILNDSLIVPVEITTDKSAEVTVGKATVSLQESENSYGDPSFRSQELYAYPGIYTVSTSGTEYLSSEPQELRVTHPNSGSAHVELSTEVTDKLRELVLEEVRAFSTACVTPPTNMDDGCPSQLQATDLASFSVKTPADSVLLDSLNTFSSSEVTFKYKRNNTEYSKYDEQELVRTLKGEIDWSTEIPEVNVTGTSWW